jgi:hypothetical protein
VTVTNLPRLVETLARVGVEFIIAGGVAANLHGSARTTIDLDVIYRRSDGNLERIVRALAPLHPYLRGVPPGLPFTLDVPTLKRGLNFTLTTDRGALDLLGEITGGGGYDDLVGGSEAGVMLGVTVRRLSLGQLIAAKRAAGRPKDLVALSELEALLEERERRD